MKSKLSTALISLSLILVGCTDDSATRSGLAEPGEGVSEQEIDRLRALGYLDFTEETVEPDEKVTQIIDPERSCPGYNLVTSRDLSLAQLIDPHGGVINSWVHQPSASWSNAILTDSGDLLVAGQAQPMEGYLLRLSWDGEIIWKSDINAHHDVEVTPTGLLAALTERRRRISDVHDELDVLDHQISLLTQDGELLEHHSLYDMLIAAPEIFSFQRVAPKDGVVDLFHSNSVEFMRHKTLATKHPIYTSGNVIVSIRNQDVIAIFDLDAQRPVWVWGQGELSGPHDATVLSSGHILLFDNGLGRNWSRVVELDPLSRQIVWEYRALEPRDFYTASRGSNQRLPNGNTLIANSMNGKAFEVTSDGEIVWSFRNPNTNDQGFVATIVRIMRYDSTFIHDLMKANVS